MRLLIVLTGALGDVVRALPLLGRLRQGFPAAEIEWVVEPLSAPLLQGHPWLDQVHVFERRRGVAGAIALSRELHRRHYDLALELGRSAKSAFFTLASGARERIGFDRADAREGSWLVATRRVPRQGPGRSKLDQFLAFGDLLGLPAAPIEFGLVVTEAEAAAARQLTSELPRPLIAACLGSSCSSRRWFADRTAQVLDAMAASSQAGAILLGTVVDAPFALEVVRRTHARVRDLAGRTSVRQLLAVLAAADVAFGPDSGALHLAAAVGTPVVSLWGATSPARSAPRGSERLVLAGEAPCAPCFLSRCPIGRLCMDTIAVEAVRTKVAEALAA